MKTKMFLTLGNAILWQTIQYGGEKVVFFIRLVILAKLLDPLDFGLLATASIGIDVMMRLSNFGMTTALVQLNEAETEHFDSAWTVDVLRSVAIGIIAFFAAPYISTYLMEPRATDILRVLALRPVLDASASIMITRFSRSLNFRALVLLQLPKALFNTIISIVLARQFGVWAMVAGTIGGSVVFLALSYILAPHKPRFLIRVETIRPLIQFGRWVFLTSIVVMISQTLVRIVISRQLGAVELGLYYLATSLAFMPTDIANQIVGKVAFPFYSRLQKNIIDAAQAFKSILISVTVLLFPVSVLMIAVAPTLVNDVLGPDWEGTINIIRILAIVNIFDVLGETISPILNGTGHPDKIFILESIQSVILISFVTNLANTYGALGAALSWLPATAGVQIVGLFFVHRLFNNPFSGLGIPLFTIMIISILGALFAIAIDQVIAGWIGFLASSMAGFGLIVCLLWVIERRFTMGLLDGFQRAFPPFFAWLGLTPR